MAMMDVQLNAWLLFEHAPRHFGTTEVVTHLGPRVSTATPTPTSPADPSS